MNAVNRPRNFELDDDNAVYQYVCAILPDNLTSEHHIDRCFRFHR